MHLLFAVFIFVTNGAVAAGPAAPEDKALLAKIEKMKDYSLCEEAGRASRSKDSSPRAQKWAELVQTRVKANGWMSDKEIAFARERRLELGMSTCAAVAALGRPDRISTTTYPQGVVSQWVYERPGRSSRYLHFNGSTLATFDH